MNARLELVQNNVPHPARALLAADPPARIAPGVMRVLDWPARDRPRERLLKLGAQTLSDAELLALFLNTGRPGMTSVDVARDLLVRFESIRGALGATAAELRGFGGSGRRRRRCCWLSRSCASVRSRRKPATGRCWMPRKRWKTI
ncbi:hypothetical protein ABH944_006981 [Caballeronia udeis]|uniref:UPF0758 domain-containing protein n=1 Tax=Caballeronia udeis TaxID=1232866 RepID=A0ABW8MTY7_9BURK